MYDDEEVSPMDHHAVWTILKQRGVAKAVVRFSGGNDSGGVDGPIQLKNASGTVIAELEEFYPSKKYDHQTGQWVPTKIPDEDDALSAALAAPVYERYHSFAGEFSVDGKVVWDVGEEQVKMGGQETVEHYESFGDLDEDDDGY